MAKGGSESAAEGLECREGAGEYRRAVAEPRRGGGRVLEIQTKLHRWATDDPDRRFNDLYNLVCDPAFLVVAWERVRTNKGARSAGVDGETVRALAAERGPAAVLAELRAELRARSFEP